MADYNTGVPSAQMQGKLKKFDNIITVTKTGYGDYVCTDPAYATDSACIQAALNYISGLGGGTLYLQGHFICPTQLLYTGSNLTIIGDDANTILDFSSVTSSIICLYCHGSITTTNSALAANAAAGTLKITVADGAKFAVGNWILVRSEAYCQPYVTDPIGAPWLQHVGEIQQIASISGDEITLKEPLCGSYLTADTATADLVTMLENITIRNVKLIGNPTVNLYGINISQAHNVIIENIQCEDINTSICDVKDCVGVRYNENVLKRANREGLGYGIAIMNACRNVKVSKNDFSDCRHGIACGGDHLYGMQYNQIWTKNTMSYGNPAVGMCGPHPTYKGLIISDNTCIGCSLGFVNGIDTTVTGNIVENSNAVGFSIQSSAEGVIFSNNRIQTIADHCITIRTQKTRFTLSNNHLSCSALDCDGINAAYQFKDVDVTNNRINVAGVGINFTTYQGLNDSENVSIVNNKIRCTGPEPGIMITSTTYNISDVTVEDNTVISAADGITFTCANKNITHAVVENNEVTVPATARSIYFTSSGTGIYLRSSISHNKCYGGLNCIDFMNCTYIDVINNHIYDAAQYGMLIGSGTTYYNVIRNTFTNCSTAIQRNAGITGRRILDNEGYNPIGFFTPEAVPASGDGTTNVRNNNYGYPCEVCIAGGTVTAIYISGTATGLTSGTVTVYPGQSIGLTYSSAPTWTWRGL